jgi:hypothetical protein
MAEGCGVGGVKSQKSEEKLDSIFMSSLGGDGILKISNKEYRIRNIE